MMDSESTVPADTTAPVHSRRGGWLWLAAAVVIVAAIAITAVVVMRQRQQAREHALALQQLERFRLLGSALREHAPDDGALPETVPADLNVAGASGASQSAAQLTRDLATGEPIIYRPVTPAGERLRVDPLGERIIAWTPQASYRGARVVLLNDLSARFLPDSMIDFDAQSFVDPLNRTAPKLSREDEEEGEMEDDEPQEEETDASTTAPADEQPPATAPPGAS